MAKPLNERIASARSTDRVTIETLRDVIAETKAEIERQETAHAAADADSTDIALSEADRDEAAANAARASRMVKAYAAAIEDLEEKLRRKLESESYKAAEAEKAAAIAERDELAARFREVVPAAVEQLTALFAAVQQNAERLRAAGAGALDAEVVARGLPNGFRGLGGEPESFTKMKIPRFEGTGRVWPVAKHFNPDLGRDAILASRQRMREEASRWNRYVVSPPAGVEEPVTIRTKAGPTQVFRRQLIAVMCVEGVEDARKRGCRVEPVAANASIGMPMAGNF